MYHFTRCGGEIYAAVVRQRAGVDDFYSVFSRGAHVAARRERHSRFQRRAAVFAEIGRFGYLKTYSVREAPARVFIGIPRVERRF